MPETVYIPYAVLETEGEVIKSFKEKPTYTYYSNAGIYLFKREFLSLIPENQFYNATDFAEDLIKQGCKLVHYPIMGYWLDIGRHEEYEKAKQDINHIQL